MMRKHCSEKLTLTLLLLFISMLQVYAQKINVSTDKGLMTMQEKRSYDQQVLTYQLHENNFKKRLSWQDSFVIVSLGDMYLLTKEIKYLNKMVDLVDDLLAKRNDTQKGYSEYVSGEKIPAWPTRQKILGSKKKHGEVLYGYYVNVVLTANILYPITYLARIITSEKTIYSKIYQGMTYLERAKAYVAKSLETVNYFLNSKEWFDQKKLLFTYPSNPKHDKMVKGLRGQTLAFNRMFVMGRTMNELKEACKNLNASAYANYIKISNEIIYKMIRFFLKNLIVKENSEGKYYQWHYKVTGKERKDGTTEAPHFEDAGHLGLDLKCLTYFYFARKDHFGLTESDFKAMANTLLNIMYDPKNECFSYHMDGLHQANKAYGKKSKAYRKTQSGFTNYLSLGHFDKRIYALCSSNILAQGAVKAGAFTQLMKLREAFMK